MVRKFSAREDLPDLENALEVDVRSNVFNGTFFREKELYNGMPIFSRRPCNGGGWQLLYDDTTGQGKSWTLKTKNNITLCGQPRTWDPKVKLFIRDKGGECEHEMNTTVEVTRSVGGKNVSRKPQNKVVLSKEEWELYQFYGKQLKDHKAKLQQMVQENEVLKNQIESLMNENTKVMNENTLLKVKLQQVKATMKQVGSRIGRVKAVMMQRGG